MEDTDKNAELLEAYRLDNHANFIHALENGADPDAPYNASTSLFVRVIGEQKFDFAQSLLRFGADPKKPAHNSNMFSLPVLSAAITSKADLSFIALLIDKGAPIHMDFWSDKKNPLHYAADMSSLDVVQLLLSKGADPNARDNIGETPLYIAALRGKTDIAVFLIEQHAADINAVTQNGRNLLHAACDGGSPALANYLLKKGLDPNQLTAQKESPLHLAMYARKTETVELLLAAGAKANVCDQRGDTPLHDAAMCGWNEGIRLLLAAGAGLDIKADDGTTPIMRALTKINTLDLLIKSGADISICDGIGRTALHAAVRIDFPEAAEKLLDAGAKLAEIKLSTTPVSDKMAEVLLNHGLPLSSLASNSGFCAQTIRKWQARTADPLPRDTPALRLAKTGETRAVLDLYFTPKTGLDTEEIFKPQDAHGNTPVDIIGAHGHLALLFHPDYWPGGPDEKARRLAQKIPPVYRAQAKRGLDALITKNNLARLEKAVSPRTRRPG